MKILVTDIDGTLINDGPLNQAVVTALKRLKRNGWEIVLATGRIMQSSLDVIKTIEPYYLGIFSDGAQICEISAGRIISEKTLMPGIANTVLSRIWHMHVEIQIFHGNQVICRKEDIKTPIFFNSLKIYVRPELEKPYIRFNPARIIIYGHPGILIKAESFLRNCPDITERDIHITWAGKNFLDILPFGVSKGNALAELLAMQTIHPDIIVALGDHMNDLEMLDKSDLGVCPSNAISQVKAVSRVEYPSDVRVGIPKLVDFLLKNEEYSKNMTNKLIL